jgi:hypothetical protein
MGGEDHRIVSVREVMAQLAAVAGPFRLVVSQHEKANHQDTQFTKIHKVNLMFSPEGFSSW